MIMTVNRVFRYAGICLIFFSILSLPASAFKTGYGKAPIHGYIIKDALAKRGFQSEHIAKIKEGADSQDVLTSEKFTDSPQNHCDDCMIKESIEYFRGRFKEALRLSAAANNSKVARDKALYAFGEGLHTVQDFYSHSNYTEMLLSTGSPNKVVNWDALPPNIKTGYFYWNGYTDNELTRSRPACIRNIMAVYKQKGKTLKFHDQYEWTALQKLGCYSLKERLAYVLSPSHQLLHFELNKDDEGEIEGAVLLKDGTTMHARARALATMETERQWDSLEAEIKRTYGQRANSIIAALKGDSIQSLDVIVYLPPEIQAGSKITGNVSVVLSGATEPQDLELIVTAYKQGSLRFPDFRKKLLKKENGTYNVNFDFPYPSVGRVPELQVRAEARFVQNPQFRKAVKITPIKILFSTRHYH